MRDRLIEMLSEDRDQSTRKTPRYGVGARQFATSLRNGDRIDPCVVLDEQ